ncbi:MAG: hypothetical protein V3W44_01055, partial [Dehalococcoidales bacterium]
LGIYILKILSILSKKGNSYTIELSTLKFAAIRVRGKVKINLGSKTEKKVDIFLIFVLNVLQVQKAISYHLMKLPNDFPGHFMGMFAHIKALVRWYAFCCTMFLWETLLCSTGGISTNDWSWPRTA